MNTLRYMVKCTIFSFVIIALLIFYIYSLTFSTNGVVKVKSGTSASHMVNELLPHGNIFEKMVLRFYISKSAKIGNYTFNSGERVLKIASKIKNGLSDVCTITFIPGKTFSYYKKQIMSYDDFSGDITVDIPEGYILPDTYTHRCQSSRNFVLLHAREKMDEYLREILSDVDFQTFYLKNPNEVLTMASIVEKETGVGFERDMVASVFKNRLKLGMRLQTDPTVIYQESGRTGELGRSLTVDDLKVGGDYNTYVIRGLPPTPIASPSREAIYATINPADTKYLYFVATGNGGHNFSESYEKHIGYVHSYRKVVQKRQKTVPHGTLKNL